MSLDDGCHLLAAIRLGATVGIDADRHFIFADPVDAAGDVEFRAEHDAIESVDDLGVGEGRALGRAALGDFGMLGPRVRRPERGRDQGR